MVKHKELNDFFKRHEMNMDHISYAGILCGEGAKPPLMSILYPHFVRMRWGDPHSTINKSVELRLG